MYKYRNIQIYYLYITIPVHLCIFCSCFKSCKSLPFYTIFDILHGKNLKHMLIYDIEINI